MDSFPTFFNANSPIFLRLDCRSSFIAAFLGKGQAHAAHSCIQMCVNSAVCFSPRYLKAVLRHEESPCFDKQPSLQMQVVIKDVFGSLTKVKVEMPQIENATENLYSTKHQKHHIICIFMANFLCSRGSCCFF